jgi:hypothetical protein
MNTETYTTLCDQCADVPFRALFQGNSVLAKDFVRAIEVESAEANGREYPFCRRLLRATADGDCEPWLDSEGSYYDRASDPTRMWPIGCLLSRRR